MDIYILKKPKLTFRDDEFGGPILIKVVIENQIISCPIAISNSNLFNIAKIIFGNDLEFQLFKKDQFPGFYQLENGSIPVLCIRTDEDFNFFKPPITNEKISNQNKCIAFIF